MCKHVAEKIDSNDEVLECACGTGMISVCIAPVCNSLVATDYSDGMFRNAKENCKAFSNVRIEKGDIMHLPYADGSFDKVVAANVIHLLDKPELALAELMRVCRKGGMVIIPTYVGGMLVGIVALMFLLPALFIVFQWLQEHIQRNNMSPAN